MAFLWALCVFHAPLQAIGILPFILLDIFKVLSNNKIAADKFKWNHLWQTIKKYANPVNLMGGGSILVVSYLYFSQSTLNNTGESVPPNIILFIVFLLLEGGLLWLIVYPGKRDLQWLNIGLLLLVFMFLHNDTFDFGEKMSSAPLFILMIAVGDFVFQQRKTALHIALVVILLIGSVTALYEISRAIVQTTAYYTSASGSQPRWDHNLSASCQAKVHMVPGAFEGLNPTGHILIQALPVLHT